MLENVNITQIYKSLIELCDVSGFEVSSIRKINDPIPVDLRMVFYPNKLIKVPTATISATVNKFINGRIQHINVYLDTEKNIVVYLQFTNCDLY